MNAREHLARVARALGDLCERVVFVGGATVDLFITDRAAGAARFTEDVDVIVRAASRLEFHELERLLSSRGFKPDMREGAPICRWVQAELTLDLMPTDGSILGFTNLWYESGIDEARAVELDDGLRLRILTGPHFLATKLEAFAGRGRDDYLASADIEDIVRVIDGRPEIVAEVAACTPALRSYLRDKFRALLANEAFLEALPGHLEGDVVSQARAEIVLARIREAAR